MDAPHKPYPPHVRLHLTLAVAQLDHCGHIRRPRWAGIAKEPESHQRAQDDVAHLGSEKTCRSAIARCAGRGAAGVCANIPPNSRIGVAMSGTIVRIAL